MLTSIIAAFSFIVLPLHANHLDGLWRNDRTDQTLRIEQDQDGFRVKRTDQGIWYHYTADEGQRYVDRKGNWYALTGNDELIWNDVYSNKRIYFTKVDNRNGNRWSNRGNNYGNNYDSYTHSNNDRWNNNRNYHGNNYDPYTHSSTDRWNNRGNNHGNNENPYHHANRDRWKKSYNSDARNNLEGDWYDQNGKAAMHIKSFQDGIKVKSKHHGQKKFYAERSGNRFSDKKGNSIRVINGKMIRYRNRNTGEERIYTHDQNDFRHQHSNHEKNNWFE